MLRTIPCEHLMVIKAVVERVKVWRCIGCGRIEGEQPCIGICEDRPAELVFAADYDDLATRESESRGRLEALEGLVRQLASTTPSNGGWERSYRFFQDYARRMLPGYP